MRRNATDLLATPGPYGDRRALPELDGKEAA